MRRLFLCCALFLSFVCAAHAADYPKPKEGDWVVRDFKFHTGEVLPELKLHYTTVGEPSGEPVLVLHGTTGSAASMLTAGFAGELFGPGQPLDARRYYLILTDAIGTGKSSKPSDGLRMRFPKYNYDDMVRAQYRLVTEHLGVKHLRLVIGNSMGGMQSWMWAQMYPAFMDIAVPMASTPSEMSGRNWMMRRLLAESIRNDPDWQGGNYKEEPRGWRIAAAFFATGTSGGNHGQYKLGPTREKADAVVENRIKAVRGDANDQLLQWESSYDYNPAPQLERIEATLVAINSADDERNPPELGILDREIRKVKKGRIYLIPASEQTTGHATTGQAKFYKAELAQLLEKTPHRQAQAGMPDELAAKVAAIGRVIDPAKSIPLYAPLQEKEPYQGVKVARDVRYGPDARNLLDVFSPEAASSPRPVLVYVHGGGFAGGNKRAPGSPFYDNINLWAVRHGMVGVNMTYRLAPAAKWPAGAEDVGRALAWVRANVAAHGGDPARIYVMGNSAGATHVADWLAQVAEKKLPAVPVAGAILLSGVYDFTKFPTADNVKAYFGDNAEAYADRSALHGLLQSNVPLVVSHAELDPVPFVEQADELREALCKSARGCPQFLVLAKHNHLTQVQSINTADTTLTRHVLDFVK
jgi:homoserine O-acetyltransferase